jgi:hypothetical protein
MKTTLMTLISLCALCTTALAETNRGFDGAWVGEEYLHAVRGKWSQESSQDTVPIAHPTFIIGRNGSLVGRLNGPAAGRFDHVVLKGGTLYFGAGNTTFELTLSNNGQTLNETARLVTPRGRYGEGECRLSGHFHRQ